MSAWAIGAAAIILAMAVAAAVIAMAALVVARRADDLAAEMIREARERRDVISITAARREMIADRAGRSASP